jgi:hypothetical protein
LAAANGDGSGGGGMQESTVFALVDMQIEPVDSGFVLQLLRTIAERLATIRRAITGPTILG